LIQEERKPQQQREQENPNPRTLANKPVAWGGLPAECSTQFVTQICSQPLPREQGN
jgi:hypothetical protein